MKEKKKVATPARNAFGKPRIKNPDKTVIAWAIAAKKDDKKANLNISLEVIIRLFLIYSCKGIKFEIKFLIFSPFKRKIIKLNKIKKVSINIEGVLAAILMAIS